MKKLLRSYWSLLLCGVLFVGIGKVSGPSKLYAFSHSLDIHADHEAVEKKAKAVMDREARERKEAKYWKDYYERQAREKRDREKKENDRIREENRRRDEVRKEREEYKRIMTNMKKNK